jgi:hypothetical protein
MDDEEYRRLVEQRNKIQLRFNANRARGTGDRRLTIFNPADPNNSNAFKFPLKSSQIGNGL